MLLSGENTILYTSFFKAFTTTLSKGKGSLLLRLAVSTLFTFLSNCAGHRCASKHWVYARLARAQESRDKRREDKKPRGHFHLGRSPNERLKLALSRRKRGGATFFRQRVGSFFSPTKVKLIATCCCCCYCCCYLQCISYYTLY